MLWLFTALDLLVLFSITISHFDILFSPYLLFLSFAYLAIKGFLFFGEAMSFIDLGIAVYVLLLLLGIKIALLYYLAAFWFAYKLIFTLVS